MDPNGFRPRLSFDVLARLAQSVPMPLGFRLARMNRALSNTVFERLVKITYENPSLEEATLPLNYAMRECNFSLLAKLRDILLRNHIRPSPEATYTPDWGSCVGEAFTFATLQFLSVHPRGRQVMEWVLDSCIETNTISSLRLWTPLSNGSILSNCIYYDNVVAIDVILQRREHIDLERFEELLSWWDLPVVFGQFGPDKIRMMSPLTAQAIIQGTNMSFQRACELCFAPALRWFLNNDTRFADDPDLMLVGLRIICDHAAGWSLHPRRQGARLEDAMSVLIDFWKSKNGTNDFPVEIGDRLLERAWRAVVPYARYQRGVGDAPGVTRDALVDGLESSISCSWWGPVLNTVLDLIPGNLLNNPMLGSHRFADFIRDRNLNLQVNFAWTQTDHEIMSTGRITTSIALLL
ncbi:hypothetical protein F5Y11DRAFT_316702 [Daldinia sp. FL1419]|nr:hypothetical protein F5Y11DRAFT_316702 [Daldinia sp. FL1419]